MTAEARRKPAVTVGSERPRVAPPLPARVALDAFREAADELGLKLYPWQVRAAHYLTALDADDRWLFRHVPIVVSRQQGKSTLLKPLIVSRMRMGHRIMHTAQDRVLPREIYADIADFFSARPAELAVRDGRILTPRWANGQEEIRLRNGGLYSIVAPNRGGARGPSRDLVIIDELREMADHDFIAGATPTLVASPNPQMVYLSNAGDENSIVLNELRAAQGTDPSMAYLEWSAEEGLAIDDLAGWLQANPAIGHKPGVFESLQKDLATHRARGTLAIFETENLCRWVVTVRERLVDEADFAACRVGVLGAPRRPAVGVSMDPDGRRASVAIAWQVDAGIAIQLVADEVGAPVDLEAVGQIVRDLSRRHAAPVGYDPMTDGELAKYAAKGKASSIGGAKFANASATFANLVSSGRLRWTPESGGVADDLTWTARKPDGEPGHYHAVRAKDDRPITASLAAIRAVGLASGPKQPTARVY